MSVFTRFRFHGLVTVFGLLAGTALAVPPFTMESIAGSYGVEWRPPARTIDEGWPLQAIQRGLGVITLQADGTVTGTRSLRVLEYRALMDAQHDNGHCCDGALRDLEAKFEQTLSGTWEVDAAGMGRIVLTAMPPVSLKRAEFVASGPETAEFVAVDGGRTLRFISEGEGHRPPIAAVPGLILTIPTWMDGTAERQDPVVPCDTPNVVDRGVSRRR